MSGDAGAEGQRRILVVNDEPIIRDVVRMMLGQLGHDGEFVGDGPSAVEKYREAIEAGTRFDAVIVDLSLPAGMDGVDTVKALREIDPEVKALVSTGYAGGEVVDQHKQYGFCGVVNKPFNLDQLTAALEKVFD